MLRTEKMTTCGRINLNVVRVDLNIVRICLNIVRVHNPVHESNHYDQRPARSPLAVAWKSRPWNSQGQVKEN